MFAFFFVSSEHFHRLLNERVTISAEEHDRNDIFVLADIADRHVYNSAPINSTYIIRSIPAIGCELQLPIDFNLNVLSTTNQNNAQATFNYLD